MAARNICRELTANTALIKVSVANKIIVEPVKLVMNYEL